MLHNKTMSLAHTNDIYEASNYCGAAIAREQYCCGTSLLHHDGCEAQKTHSCSIDKVVLYPYISVPHWHKVLGHVVILKFSIMPPETTAKLEDTVFIQELSTLFMNYIKSSCLPAILPLRLREGILLQLATEITSLTCGEAGETLLTVRYILRILKTRPDIPLTLIKSSMFLKGPFLSLKKKRIKQLMLHLISSSNITKLLL